MPRHRYLPSGSGRDGVASRPFDKRPAPFPHSASMSSSKRAVLLVNLGSPDSTDVPDVRRYLREFLGDERVIDLKPRWLAWFLVNCIISPRRAPKSAEAYKAIWQPDGSPLVLTSFSVQRKLVAALGPETPVFLAMRYGSPAIPAHNTLTALLAATSYIRSIPVSDNCSWQLAPPPAVRARTPPRAAR